MRLDRITHLLIDMDGVLWRGERPLPGLANFFALLRAREMGFVLLTNNSTRTVADYVEKLARFGVDVEAGQVLTSALATADWLAGQLSPGARVYAVGEEGLRAALTEAGFAVVTDAVPERVEAVVAGLYFGLDYQTVYHASRLVRRGALFVGTNPDATLPTPNGLAPGAGSILAAIAAASGVEPLVIGKPNALMFEQALARLGARPENTAMVGDRLETDVLGGQRAGLKTALLLSGATGAGELAGSEIRPTWVFDDITALAGALNSVP